MKIFKLLKTLLPGKNTRSIKSFLFVDISNIREYNFDGYGDDVNGRKEVYDK